jgi:hypothetical protein
MFFHGSELRMLKVNNICNDLPRSRTRRLLYLLFLAFVVFYPIADAALDAFSDHLTHSPRMLPDERIQSDQQNHPIKIAITQQVSVPAISAIIDGPFFHAFITRVTPATAIKPSQTCPLLSSGLSPPDRLESIYTATNCYA